ncbi:MAG: type II toxin-antitoxin system RelE/ParE family toxin [bacterium]|nr:type II toxin-antitoxin system RelE/ParE family toxin [bacterium]
MGEVVYSPKALADIERIHNYIRDALLNPPAAERIVTMIFDAGDSLAATPRPGAPFRSDLDLLKYYRYLTVENYLLVFRVQDGVARIVRVLHRLQDSISILLNEPF